MTASPARRFARQVVTTVRERSGFAHDVLDAALRQSTLSPEDRALATRLAYGSIQTEGTLDETLDRYITGGRVEPRVRDALRVAAYPAGMQILPGIYPAFAGYELAPPDPLCHDCPDRDPLRNLQGKVNLALPVAGQHLLTVRQQCARFTRGVSKTHAAQLGPGILEREINVAGRLRAQVRDLAAHPDLAHGLLQQPPDLRCQFADGQNFSDLFRRKQFAEVPL